MAACALLALLVTAAQQGAPAPPDEAPATEFPAELPPPGDELLDLLEPDDVPALERVRVFAHGRARVELDDSRDRAPAVDLQTGFTLRGRVGFEAPVGPHVARIVVGDGVRLGDQRVTLPLPFVDRDPASFLYEVHLALDAALFGIPGRLSLGRFPVQVADGRLVGKTDFDPRGRSLDGGLWTIEGKHPIRVGAFYLGPLDPADGADSSGLVFVDQTHELGDLTGAAYLLLHRDGRPARAGRDPVTAVTPGLRYRYAPGWFYASLGGDLQPTLLDDDPLTPVAWGFHGELALGVKLDHPTATAPRFEIGAEVSGSDVAVEGLRFRTPAPDLHRYLGALDTIGTDNAWSAWLSLALEDDDGFAAVLEPRLFGLTDPAGALLDPLGRTLVPANDARDELGVALFEVDARVRIPASPGVFLDGEYGIGFAQGVLPGTVPTQRLWLAVTFDLDGEVR
jgi:hypothetical protein